MVAVAKLSKNAPAKETTIARLSTTKMCLPEGSTSKDSQGMDTTPTAHTFTSAEAMTTADASGFTTSADGDLHSSTYLVIGIVSGIAVLLILGVAWFLKTNLRECIQRLHYRRMGIEESAPVLPDPGAIAECLGGRSVRARDDAIEADSEQIEAGHLLSLESNISIGGASGWTSSSSSENSRLGSSNDQGLLSPAIFPMSLSDDERPVLNTDSTFGNTNDERPVLPPYSSLGMTDDERPALYTYSSLRETGGEEPVSPVKSSEN